MMLFAPLLGTTAPLTKQAANTARYHRTRDADCHSCMQDGRLKHYFRSAEYRSTGHGKGNDCHDTGEAAQGSAARTPWELASSDQIDQRDSN